MACRRLAGHDLRFPLASRCPHPHRVMGACGPPFYHETNNERPSALTPLHHGAFHSNRFTFVRFFLGGALGTPHSVSTFYVRSTWLPTPCIVFDTLVIQNSHNNEQKDSSEEQRVAEAGQLPSTGCGGMVRGCAEASLKNQHYTDSRV